MLRILHVTAYHLSLSSGGTEVYIDSLCESLYAVRNGDVENHCIVFSKTKPSSYDFKNVTFINPSDGELGKVLKSEISLFSPNFVCIHTLTSPEFRVAEICIENNIPYLYFHHASQWCCFQGDFKFMGKIDCANFSNPAKCAICMHVPKYGIIKSCLKQILDWTILRNSNQWGWYQIAKNRISVLHRFLANARINVVFSKYDHDILLKNGALENNIEIVPQRLPRKKIDECGQNTNIVRTGKLKIGYVGRVVSIKGVDILLKAFSCLQDKSNCELHIYGCDSQTEYCSNLFAKYQDIPGVCFHSILPSNEIIREYSKLDVLCIPSRVHETGPLTLLEGLCSGCRVACVSNVGQIDLLRNYGVIITENKPEQWLSFFEKCLCEKEMIRSRKVEISLEDFSMDTVAKKILQLGLENV